MEERLHAIEESRLGRGADDDRVGRDGQLIAFRAQPGYGIGGGEEYRVPNGPGGVISGNGELVTRGAEEDRGEVLAGLQRKAVHQDSGGRPRRRPGNRLARAERENTRTNLHLLRERDNRGGRSRGRSRQESKGEADKS